MSTSSSSQQPQSLSPAPTRPADVAKRMEFLLQDHGFTVVAYFGCEETIRFILVTCERQGFDLLLQIPRNMKLDSVKAHSSCQIELLHVTPEWSKRAGEQADIDLKFMTRNMRQLLENIDENVKVHNRIERLKLAWFDPTRKLLFVEGVRQASASARYAVNDIARCPEWVANRSTIWFSAPIDWLFTQNFSLWEEGVLTGQWLRSTMWHDEKRLWSAMNANWKSLLGDRLLRSNEPHPYTAQFKGQSERIVTLQDEMVRLRKLSLRDSDQGDRAREMMVRGGGILLKRHREVISALLAYGDVAEEWHTFFPAFEYSMNTARRYVHGGALAGGRQSMKAKAAQAFDSVVQWLEGGEAAEGEGEADVSGGGGADEAEDESPAAGLFAAERPLTHRLAQLHQDDAGDSVGAAEPEDGSLADRTKISLGMMRRPPLVAPSVELPVSHPIVDAPIVFKRPAPRAPFQSPVAVLRKPSSADSSDLGDLGDLGGPGRRKVAEVGAVDDSEDEVGERADGEEREGEE